MARPDPLPVDHPLIGKHEIAALKGKILASGLTVSQLMSTAWASASTFRGSDKRGGANGARIRLAPQKDWDVNQPAQVAKVLQALEAIQREFNASQSGRKKVSLADLIVLGGCAAIEKAAKDAGQEVKIPFTPGRMDASQEQTDVDSFAPLEPTADGFRNYLRGTQRLSAEELLVDRAQLLTLEAVQKEFNASQSGGKKVSLADLIVLGGCAAIEKAAKAAGHDVKVPFTSGRMDASQEQTDVDSFAPLEPTADGDLIFGSHSQLRALAEVYACADSKEKFVADFVAAWTKVMDLDRFDIGERTALARPVAQAAE